jgi:starch synthase (maltosyl-transferring)
MTNEEGRRGIVIEGVKPEIDGGRFPIKRITGEKVVVEADIFVDSHEVIACTLLYRREEASLWEETPMRPVLDDRWRGSFEVSEIGRHVYTIRAWVDRFKSWRQALTKKVDAGLDVAVDILVGVEIIKEASQRAAKSDVSGLERFLDGLVSDQQQASKIQLSLDAELEGLMSKYPDRRGSTTYEKELPVVVDRQKARFSSWYEMFPRSFATEPGNHGTFKECEARLPYIAEMGFDVLYFPPIHPIGFTNRKGKNNNPFANNEAPGSPWAIGSKDGGHKAVHPKLGSLDDFRHLVLKAQEHSIEIALDLAFQCSPDHPYVRQHPGWFRVRPDGSVQYAENPPKKYEDIYPFDFETEEWQELWKELKDVVLFWVAQGVKIFRVDNPHTKPFRFWEWLISEVKRGYPEVIFLSEAFTRPKVMFYLAKLGFTQSYTYFAWRNTKREMRKYLEELTQTPVREFFRPSLWPNTPDILTEYLQTGGRTAFLTRLILAATLGANYGIYGPAFELCENRPKGFGDEEYLDSEKYEIRTWDIKKPENLKNFISRLNCIRRENPALQSDWSLRFHSIDNDKLICYSKHTEDLANIILVVVNLDPHHMHSGWLDLPLMAFGLDPQQAFQVHDLMSENRYLWYGPRSYVEINPNLVPAHIFRVRRRVRTERDFDYFM